MTRAEALDALIDGQYVTHSSYRHTEAAGRVWHKDRMHEVNDYGVILRPCEETMSMCDDSEWKILTIKKGTCPTCGQKHGD